jgi:hypothetical protein
MHQHRGLQQPLYYFSQMNLLTSDETIIIGNLDTHVPYAFQHPLMHNYFTEVCQAQSG